MSTRTREFIREKYKVERKLKRKKLRGFSIFQKYGKFRSVSLGHFIKHESLISDEWLGVILDLVIAVFKNYDFTKFLLQQ